MWAMTKNVHLARSLLPFFDNKNVARVIISQDNKRTRTLSAAMHEKTARNRAFSSPLYLQPESEVDFTTCTTMSMNITDEKDIMTAEI